MQPSSPAAEPAAGFFAGLQVEEVKGFLFSVSPPALFAFSSFHFVLSLLSKLATMGARGPARGALLALCVMGLIVGSDCITWDVEHALACKAPTGPLDDAQCDVNAVEAANTKQLHSILEELANSTYFRLMHINLDGKCRFFNKAVAEAKCTAGAPAAPAFGGYSAAMFSPVEEPPALCSLSGGSENESGRQKSFGGGGDSFGESSSSTTTTTPTTSTTSSSAGSTDRTISFDMSFLKNPLSFLGAWGDDNTSPLTNPVDRTISEIEGQSLLQQKDESCSDPSLPDFWLDMCRNIPTNASEYLNLQLNPERWTGYNGSHVWNAIYHENCFAKMGEFEEMCYEERVLYRLLSGMHASVNIHISDKFYPPSKAKNRTEWESNPQRFMEQYGNKPEYLKNLYFSFVVLLRALRRAGPYIYNLPFTGSGSDEEALRTQQLVRRLLDSGLMTSCSSVFDAFDESLMFSSDSASSSAYPSGDPFASKSPLVSDTSIKATLKSQWKGVFHNISEVSLSLSNHRPPPSPSFCRCFLV